MKILPLFFYHAGCSFVKHVRPAWRVSRSCVDNLRDSKSALCCRPRRSLYLSLKLRDNANIMQYSIRVSAKTPKCSVYTKTKCSLIDWTRFCIELESLTSQIEVDSNANVEGGERSSGTARDKIEGIRTQHTWQLLTHSQGRKTARCGNQRGSREIRFRDAATRMKLRRVVTETNKMEYE